MPDNSFGTNGLVREVAGEHPVPEGTVLTQPISTEGLAAERPSVEEIERQVIQEQLAQNQTAYDPVEAAARVFTIYLPQYKQLVRNMSNRQMRRLLQALIEVPLQKRDYRHPTAEEKAAFVIGDRLLQAKWTMVTHTLIERMHREAQAQQAVNSPPPGAVPLDEVLQSAPERGSIDPNSNQGDQNNGTEA